jgi:hypothetical protein
MRDLSVGLRPMPQAVKRGRHILTLPFRALDDANTFTNDKRYILTNLNTLGWVVIVLGAIQLAGGLSLMAGNAFGRVIAIVGASLGAIGALLSVGGSYPWWSLGIFFLCLYVLHSIFILGQDESAVRM